MKLERTELIAKLERVSPALSSGNLIPIMRHYWFTGERLLTYNDQIAVEVPFETDFKGAVLGDTIVSLLKASRAKDVTLEPDDNGNLGIKAASAKLRLPLLPPEQFIFTMPDDVPFGNLVPAKSWDDFRAALEACLVSVSTDTSVPDQLGVTVIPLDDGVLLCSTNFSTMTQAHVKLPEGSGDLKDRAILPKSFVEQVVKLSKDAKEPEIHIYPKDGYALFTNGDAWVFGRLVESQDPLDFEALFRRNLPEDYHKLVVPIPDNMKLVLDRAVIICDATMDHHKSSITVADGVMSFYSKSERGEVKDAIKTPDHEELDTIKVEPRFLRDACDDFDDFLLSENCIVMTRPNTIYMIAVAS